MTVMENELEDKDYDLNEELIDLLEERIEEVITMIANKKEWESFDLELLTVLASFTAQLTKTVGMEQEDALEFFDQFLDEVEDPAEIIDLKSKPKSNSELN